MVGGHPTERGALRYHNFWTWLIIPVSQCIHIVCVAIVMISVGFLNLRLTGIAGTRQSFAPIGRTSDAVDMERFLRSYSLRRDPTIAEPGRELPNIGFRTKMILLIDYGGDYLGIRMDRQERSELLGAVG